MGQLFNQLDHHQRLATACCHPKTHAVDEVVISNGIVLRGDVIGQDTKDWVLLLSLAVCGGVKAPDGHLAEIGVSAITVAPGKIPLACVVVIVFFVIEIQRPRSVFQSIFLVVIQSLLR